MWKKIRNISHCGKKSKNTKHCSYKKKTDTTKCIVRLKHGTYGTQSECHTSTPEICMKSGGVK